ncbi:MAG TPA: MaoC/PaaZ C-terminal domain-containing protein [Nocardioides sp.]
MSALSTGAELGPNTFTITRADLVRYAGASGDFNPIHWNDRIATMVGLPGVIAHGMFTMALVASAVDEWAGAGRTVEFGGKFTNPVVVPDDDEGVQIEVSGKVGDVADGRATIVLTVTCGGTKVLGMPKAVVRV